MLDALGRQAMLNLELRRHKAALAERLEGLNDQLEKLGVDRVAPLSPEEGVGPDDELGRI